MLMYMYRGGARKFKDQFLEIADLQLQRADELTWYTLSALSLFLCVKKSRVIYESSFLTVQPCWVNISVDYLFFF